MSETIKADFSLEPIESTFCGSSLTDRTVALHVMMPDETQIPLKLTMKQAKILIAQLKDAMRGVNERRRPN